MKAKHAIIILVAGFCVDVVGITMRIMHWRHAMELVGIGMALKVIGGLLLLYKIITYPKIRDFMNH